MATAATAAQTTAFVLTFHSSAVKTCPGQRGTAASRWLRFPRFHAKIHSHPIADAFSSSFQWYRQTDGFIVSSFLTSSFSPPRLSFVLRLRLLAAPPEHQVLECWCQSRSPSWHGTCIDWHRTPALLWPVPKLLGTLETLYPNSGPPRLLEKHSHCLVIRLVNVF